MNWFWLIEGYIFANDFLRFFDRSFQKNVKSHVFLKSEKKRKIHILEHWRQGVDHPPDGRMGMSREATIRVVPTLTLVVGARPVA